MASRKLGTGFLSSRRLFCRSAFKYSRCLAVSSHSPVGRAIGGGQAFSSGQPMGFHEVHGENVRLEQGNKVARRAESFCKAIVFSSRPVQVNEKVVLRLTEISNSWSGALRYTPRFH